MMTAEGSLSLRQHLGVPDLSQYEARDPSAATEPVDPTRAYRRCRLPCLGVLT
jgi:hypothetical protein